MSISNHSSAISGPISLFYSSFERSQRVLLACNVSLRYLYYLIPKGAENHKFSLFSPTWGHKMVNFSRNKKDIKFAKKTYRATTLRNLYAKVGPIRLGNHRVISRDTHIQIDTEGQTDEKWGGSLSWPRPRAAPGGAPGHLWPPGPDATTPPLRFAA